MLFEKSSLSAMVRAVTGQRRTDEIVFSEVGKQLLENNLLCDFSHERAVGTGQKFSKLFRSRKAFFRRGSAARQTKTQCQQSLACLMSCTRLLACPDRCSKLNTQAETDRQTKKNTLLTKSYLSDELLDKE